MHLNHWQQLSIANLQLISHDDGNAVSYTIWESCIQTDVICGDTVASDGEWNNVMSLFAVKNRI